jgi:hypothetical protein
VLTGDLTWLRKKDNNEGEMFLVISGLDTIKNEHYQWGQTPLAQWDEVLIRIADSRSISSYSVKTEDELKAEVLERKLKYFYKLKEELKEHLKE